MVRYRFDDLELDVDAFQLRRGEHVLPLQPKVFEVLRYLIEHRGRMVSKSELLDRLWPNEHVNEAVISWSVSHIRRALLQDRSDKRPIETVHGRGYRFTAGVDELTAPAAVPVPVAPPEPTFVGRELVMQELERHLCDAVAGRGALFVLSGEAGIGKTRCTEELAIRAAELGARAIMGRCPEAAGTPPLWPVESALLRLEGDLAARARTLIASLRDRDAVEPMAQSARFRAIEQLASALQELASAQPILLIIDDVQWADPSTLRFLSFIAPELRTLAVCIVVTLRDGERERGTTRDRTLVHALRNASSVALGSLSVAQVAALMAIITKRSPSEALAEAVHRATGGVPLFVHELVRALVGEHGEEGLVRLRPEAVRAPEVARDVLRVRIGRLPEATVRLLSHAAVIGQSFDLSLLAALLGLESEALLDQLSPAVTEGQLESETPHVYRFAHALFQAVLYDDLPLAQRIAIHRKVGELWRTRPLLEPRRGEIARHYYLSLAAGEPEEVLRLAEEAAQEARGVLAFDEAVVYLGWALQAQAHVAAYEPRARAELMFLLASSQRSAGRTGDATETAGRLIELAQQHGFHDLIIKATRNRRTTIAMATVPDPVTRAALERVLNEVSDPANPARISALAQLSWVPPYDPLLAGSKALSASALALAEQHHDRDAMFEALRARLFALSGPDDVDEALAVADRTLALDREGPHNWQSIDARLARTAAFLLAGRIAEVDRALEETAAVVGGPQWGEASFYCQRLAAQQLLHGGQIDAAERRWSDVIKHGLRAGVAYAEFLDQMFVLNLQLERVGAAKVYETLVRPLGPLSALPRALRPGYARIAAEAGALDVVRSYFESLDDLSAFPRNGVYLHGLACLSVCAVAIGDRVRCEQLFQLLAPYAALNTPDGTSFYLGAVAYFLGELSTALGRSADAANYYAQALERNRAMGYRTGIERAEQRLKARP